MAHIDQVLAAVPASLAVLEREFRTAGNLFMGARSRLDGEYAEMILSLHGSTKDIPSKIPVLTITQRDKATPTRLAYPASSYMATLEDEVAQGSEGPDEFVVEQQLAFHGVGNMPILQQGGGRGSR